MMARNAKSEEFNKVCELLTHLSEEEVAAVRLRTGFLAGSSTATAAPPRAADWDWLLAGVEAELRRRGVLGAGHLAPDRVAPGSAPVLAAACADLARHVPERRLQAALGRTAARALAHWLEAGGVPVGPRTMLQNVGKVLQALDACFPGYAEAGLLHCCLDPSMVGEYA